MFKSLRHCFAFDIAVITVKVIFFLFFTIVQGTRVLATGGASSNKDILQVCSKTADNYKSLGECTLVFDHN